jgi:hypothetical protein
MAENIGTSSACQCGPLMELTLLKGSGFQQRNWGPHLHPLIKEAPRFSPKLQWSLPAGEEAGESDQFGLPLDSTNLLETLKRLSDSWRDARRHLAQVLECCAERSKARSPLPVSFKNF